MEILKSIFPLYALWEMAKPYLCRHDMRYWDMKMSAEKGSMLERMDGKVWKDHYCECKKCGARYERSYMPKQWGTWKRSEFDPKYLDTQITTKIKAITEW